jgi:16S rRNA G966 N2-methylase RsmD
MVLDYIGEHRKSLLMEDGLVIVEHARKQDLNKEFGELRRYRELKQGDSALSFYQVPY